MKVDAEDKTKVLSDAEFEVYKDGKKVDTLRTDKTGKSSFTEIRTRNIHIKRNKSTTRI
ncbi:SpaA isopeptide-forming pilin-related protein [Bacillus cereus]